MKKILTVVFLIAFQMTYAQDWTKGWDLATQNARAQDKPILLVFSGSDWCAPCIKLDREVWSTQVFKDFAKENLVLYKADFPRRKANQLSAQLSTQNKQLAETYNQNGYFPLVVLLSPEKAVLGQTAYLNIAAEDYIEKLKLMSANE